MEQILADFIRSSLTAINIPYHRVNIWPKLGTQEYNDILVVISLNKQESWQNGILENSRYVKFFIRGKTIENTSGSLKIRKFTSKKELPTEIASDLWKKIKQFCETNLAEGVDNE